MGKFAGFSGFLARWPPERAARRRLFLSYQPRLGLTRWPLAGVGCWPSATAIQRSADYGFLHSSAGPPDATPAAQVNKPTKLSKSVPRGTAGHCGPSRGRSGLLLLSRRCGTQVTGHDVDDLQPASLRGLKFGWLKSVHLGPSHDHLDWRHASPPSVLGNELSILRLNEASLPNVLTTEEGLRLRPCLTSVSPLWLTILLENYWIVVPDMTVVKPRVENQRLGFASDTRAVKTRTQSLAVESIGTDSLAT